MKHFKSLLFSSFALFPFLAFTDTIESRREIIEDNDIRALKDWLDTKRQVSLKEIGGDLSMSGEVRTEAQGSWNTIEKDHNRVDSNRRNYDVEFNFMLDYRTERTWSSIKLEFDNDAGVFYGSLNKINLERCYWGARLADTDCYTFDIEVGRRFMSAVFDSKVQFASYFDGILFRYDRTFENVGDFYIHAGPFVVNERKDHFAYIIEFGLQNFMGTGLYSKLSFIDWDTKNYSVSFIDNRFEFLIGQFIEGYRFKIGCLGNRIGILYGAFLWNFEGKRREITDYRRENWAAYAGISIGQLRKKWDWAFDFNYQIVKAQSIPDFDVSGIGLSSGNSGFYTEDIRPLLSEGGKEVLPNTRLTAGGPTNYQGFSLRLDILLTDKIDLQQSYVQAVRLNDSIGPYRSFKFYEIELIYSW